MTTHSASLPLSTAPHLALSQATPEEKIATWRLNGEAWAGRLSVEAYVRREHHLADQSFTRNGGITFWILVDGSKAPNQREILASCESLRKRALIARAEGGGDGDVEEVVSHGIGSVFCKPEYRGRGYATRMLQELGKKLDTYQQPQGRQSLFSVLFSDIGKDFYSRAGWNPFPSSHIALPAVAGENHGNDPKPHLLKAGDLATLCAMDESTIIKAGMVRYASRARRTMLAYIPDLETMQWHHAREEFFAKELIGREPDIKGAFVHCTDDSRVWCIWARMFGSEAHDDAFHLLRLAIQGEDTLVSSAVDPPETKEDGPHGAKISAITSLLRAAQFEASKWGIKDIQIWNPTALAVRAARKIDSSIEIVHRSENSIACLRWCGSEDATSVEWLGNEKYAWC